MTQSVGELLALLAAFCGAASSVLYNRLGKKTSADIIACIRMMIAAPIMCTCAAVANGAFFSNTQPETLILLLVSGFVGYFVTDVFMFRAYVSWGARETMVVMCLTPVFSGLMAYAFMHETISAKQIIGSLFSVSGVVIMTLGDRTKGTKIISAGALLALAAAVFQSVSDITAKFALYETSWITTSAVRSVGGVFPWLILRVLKRRCFEEKYSEIHNPKFLLSITATLMIGTVIGTTAAMGALQAAPAGIVTSIRQTSPIIILMYEFIVLKKKLSVSDIAGTFVSVFGVFLLF